MNVRSEIVRSRNCHYGHSGRSLQLGTPNARAIWHVAAIPGRRRCEFNHHRNPRINIMTMVVQVARAMGTKQQSHSSLVLIVVMIPTISVLMAAHVIEVFVWALAYLILDVAPAGANLVYFAFVNYAALGYGDVLSGRKLAAAWPSNRNERHVAVWMVDRSHFRGPTANVGAHP